MPNIYVIFRLNVVNYIRTFPTLLRDYLEIFLRKFFHTNEKTSRFISKILIDVSRKYVVLVRLNLYVHIIFINLSRGSIYFTKILPLRREGK